MMTGQHEEKQVWCQNRKLKALVLILSRMDSVGVGACVRLCVHSWDLATTKLNWEGCEVTKQAHWGVTWWGIAILSTGLRVGACQVTCHFLLSTVLGLLRVQCGTVPPCKQDRLRPDVRQTWTIDLDSKRTIPCLFFCVGEGGQRC